MGGTNMAPNSEAQRLCLQAPAKWSDPARASRLPHPSPLADLQAHGARASGRSSTGGGPADGAPAHLAPMTGSRESLAAE